MNALKNLALILVVGGVGYLVYQQLYGPSKPETSPTANAPSVPKIEIPGLDRTGPAQAAKSGSTLPANPPSVASSEATSSTVSPNQFLPASRTVPASPLPDPDKSKTSSPPSPKTSGAEGGKTSAEVSGQSSRSPASSEAGKASSPDSSGRAPSSASAGGSTPTDFPKRRPDNEIGEQFLKCMQVAHEVLRQGQWTEVLIQLSPWYQHPELTRAESEKLTELLDQLAGSVIYSREHRLEPPYRVRPGDTLAHIARQYQVSWELLAKINGIPDPDHLEGMEVLKVLRGPFHALVDITHREITLMLELQDTEGQSHPLYAGRFPLRAISNASELEGQYEVLRKSPGPRAQRPGPLALELSGQVIIHGPGATESLPQSRGTIELPERDMDDLYDILTIGSRVLIRK